jgi:urease accessory protein UreF
LHKKKFCNQNKSKNSLSQKFTKLSLLQKKPALSAPSKSSKKKKRASDQTRKESERENDREQKERRGKKMYKIIPKWRSHIKCGPRTNWEEKIENSPSATRPRAIQSDISEPRAGDRVNCDKSAPWSREADTRLA